VASRIQAVGWPALPERVHGQPRDVVAPGVFLEEAHARRHLEQVPDRRAPVLGPGQPWNLGRRRIVDRTNAALGDGDADQHRCHGLGHRERREAIPLVPRVLIALDEDCVVARDEKPGGRVPREVLIQPEALAPEVVANLRLGRRPREPRRRCGSQDPPRLEDLVEVALGADEERNLKVGRPFTDRVALAGALLLGVRTVRRDARVRNRRRRR
jgi:hypothetical protein